MAIGESAPQTTCQTVNVGNRRLLLVSYVFPPVAGAGVQRPAKFAKYLPQSGWQCTVLTALNPSVPVFDEGLAQDLPPDTRIVKAKTYEPSYKYKALVKAGGDAKAGRPGLLKRAKGTLRGLANLALVPDPQILWYPQAVKVGKRLCREVGFDAVLATGPPFSCFMVASRISRQAGIPLVLDYRDEWEITNKLSDNYRLGKMVGQVHRRWQHQVLRAASVVIATTRHSASRLQTVCHEAGSQATVTHIYNGFDPADFVNLPAMPAADPDMLRVTYVGTLWNLTSAEPFLKGVAHFCQQHPRLAARLEIVLAGRKTTEQQALLTQYKDLPCRVVLHDYMNHADALSLMRGSGLLAAFLSDYPEAVRVVPAKIFEYMALRRPILCVAPKGELWDLLAQHPAAACVEPSNTVGLAAELAQAFERQSQGPVQIDPALVAPFERRFQAAELAALLDGCLANRPPKASVRQP